MYKELLPTLGGGITQGGSISPDRLRMVLQRMARDEEPAYARRAVSAGGCMPRAGGCMPVDVCRAEQCMLQAYAAQSGV